jgi:hypothetical protein
VIAFGFWAGDDNLGDAAYYSYTSPRAGPAARPAPLERHLDGLRQRLARRTALQVGPHAMDPKAFLLTCFQSAYEAGARTAGWDTSDFESTWCPTPEQLRELSKAAQGEL